MEKLINKIELLKDYQDIQLINKGYSGAEKYMVVKDGKSYFIKIQKWQTSKSVARELLQADIPHAQIYDIGEIGEKFYVVSEFLDGEDYDDKFDQLNEEEIFNSAYEVGDKYANLKTQMPDRIITEKEYLKLCEKMKKDLKTFYETDLQIFPEQDRKVLNKMYNFIKQNLITFKTCVCTYGHTDIKPSNFIYKNNKIYAVDCENVSYVNIAFASRYGIVTHKVNLIHKYLAFVNGFINGVYNNNVPSGLQNNLFYIFVLSSLENIARTLKYHNEQKASELIKAIINIKIGKMCINDL